MWGPLSGSSSQVIAGVILDETFSSAEIGLINNGTVDVTFSGNVSAAGDDFTTGVTIKDDGATTTISSGTLQTNESIVRYVLSAPVVSGSAVTWEYTGSGPLNVETTTAQSVTDNITDYLMAIIKTDNTGSSADDEFTLPASGGPYRVIDWGDGDTSDTSVSDNVTHSYSAAGTYTIKLDKISASFQPFKFLGGGDMLKLLSISQWGDIVWSAINSSFHGCTNFDITAVDLPDMDSCGSGVNTFHSCSGITGEFPPIDFSSTTNLINMFYGCSGITSIHAGIDFTAANIISAAWYGCSGLTSFPNIDLSSVASGTGSWTNCSSLTSFPALDLSGHTSGFNAMWKGCSSLTSFGVVNMSNATNISEAWSGCTSLSAMPLVDLSSVTYFASGWYNCTSLVTFPAINMHSMNNGDSCFTNVTLATADYSALLIDLAANNSNTSVTFHGGDSKYNTSGATARTTLVDPAGLNWSISDGGPL